MKLTEKPFFLVEYHLGDPQTIYMTKPDGGKIRAEGLKISRVVDTNLKELAAISPERDGVDLTCLDIEGGVHLASVSSVDGKNLVWCIMSTINHDPTCNEFIINDKWVASPEETELLNKTFPEYFDHCSLDNKEFVEKNKGDINNNEGNLQIPEA